VESKLFLSFFSCHTAGGFVSLQNKWTILFFSFPGSPEEEEPSFFPFYVSYLSSFQVGFFFFGFFLLNLVRTPPLPLIPDAGWAFRRFFFFMPKENKYFSVFPENP